MPPRRLRELRSPVHLEVDGVRIVAERGEPVTVALAASGRLTLGRSVKYHRPRGAACYVGRCDGCLMRVDGVPSVMTCRTAAQDGMVIETQNVLGSARTDLLAAADWFFPGHMNHHEMFTWSESVNKVMQKVARRIAGIGKVPDSVLEASPATEMEVDLLVIGGGPAGLHVAAGCARAGRSVIVVDEESAPGGSLRWWPGAEPAAALEAVAVAVDAGAEILSRRSAIAVYDPWEDLAGAEGATPRRRPEPPVVLVASPEGVARVHPRRTAIATGRHIGAMAFGDADRPGVIDLRAACILLAHGVCPGERVALVGTGPLGCAFAAALKDAGAEVLGPFEEAQMIAATGRNAVSGCVVREGSREAKYKCDAIVVTPGTSAVYELAAQAGVVVGWSGKGYELEVGDAGATAAPDVRVVGWAAGAATEPLERVRARAQAAADAIVEELR